jgi:hypothetical protein
MNCIMCNSDRILEINAKCSDLCILEFKGVEFIDYPPSDVNIGDGDYINIDICLNCGHAQGLSNEPDPQFYTEKQEDDDEIN